MATTPSRRRCQHVSPTPWGPAQCVLVEDHEERHAYSPSETLEVLTGQVQVNGPIADD